MPRSDAGQCQQRKRWKKKSWRETLQPVKKPSIHDLKGGKVSFKNSQAIHVKMGKQIQRHPAKFVNQIKIFEIDFSISQKSTRITVECPIETP